MSASRGENDADRPAIKSLSFGAFDVAAVKEKRFTVIQGNFAAWIPRRRRVWVGRGDDGTATVDLMDAR